MACRRGSVIGGKLILDYNIYSYLLILYILYVYMYVSVCIIYIYIYIYTYYTTSIYVLLKANF